jgi:hypothetical protein
VTDPKRLTDWELDQLRFSAEQRDIVDVPGKDLRALVDEVLALRRRPQAHPYASLLALCPVGGAALWVMTGEWRWAVVGFLALLASAAVGAAIDGAKRGAR